MATSRTTGEEPRSPFENTLDALQSTFDESQQPLAWRRNLALIGLLAAIFGIVAWYALNSDQPDVKLLQFEIVNQLSNEDKWVAQGFEQVFAAYAQTGNRVRLQRSDRYESNGSSLLPFLSSAGLTADARLRAVLLRQEDSDELLLTLSLRINDQSFERRLVGNPSELDDLASRTTLQVFSWMDVDPYSTQEADAALQEVPQNEAAARHYALGVQALRRSESKNAVDELSKALETEPSHPMINAALAEALESAGYRYRAVHQIKTAFDNRHRLSREKQLAIEARMHLLKREWRRAATLYAALTAFYPQEISYGLSLAQAHRQMSEIDEALAVLNQLRDRPEFRRDPRIDLAEAGIWSQTGAWQKGIGIAERAIHLAQTLDHPGILARAYLVRAEMSGDTKLSDLSLAHELFRDMGDLKGQGAVLREYGDLHVAKGELGEAIRLYDEAEQISRQLGNDAAVAASQQARAIASDLSGKLVEGYELKQFLLRDAQQRRLHSRAAIIMENLGVSAFKLGKLADALDWFDRALAEFRELNDEIGIAWYPYRKGQVLAHMGDLAGARVHFLQSIANAEQHPEGYLELHTRYEVARLDVFTGRPDTAERLLAIAREYDEAGLALDEADTLLVLAHLDLVHERDESARSHLKQALAVFRESGAAYYATRALTLMVRAGDTNACQPLYESAQQLEHLEVATLARVAMQGCPAYRSDLSGELETVASLRLFEPLLALTALTDPQAAQSLGDSHGWTHSLYWSRGL